METATTHQIEIWKDIDGYEGLYLISDLGNVKRLARCIAAPRGRKRMISEGTPKQYNLKGYNVVSLSKNGRQLTKMVHVLVARAFIPNTYDLKEVNHEDGIKINNNKNNLRWVSPRENVRHALQLGLKKTKYKILDTNAGVFHNSISELCHLYGFDWNMVRNRLYRRMDKRYKQFVLL